MIAIDIVEHLAIYQAFADHNPVAAEQAITNHILSTGRQLFESQHSASEVRP